MYHVILDKEMIQSVVDTKNRSTSRGPQKDMVDPSCT